MSLSVSGAGKSNKANLKEDALKKNRELRMKGEYVV